MYCTNTIIKDYKVNTDDNTVDIKLLVDNRKSNKSMTFVNSEFSTLYVSFNRDEKLKAPIESKYSDFYALYDVNYTYLTGHLVDQDGNDVKTTTIGSKKKGYVYLKYKPTTDEYATLPEDIQLGLAEIVLDKYFSDDCKETYIWITQQFKVKSGSKTYKFGIDTGKDFASFYRM